MINTWRLVCVFQSDSKPSRPSEDLYNLFFNGRLVLEKVGIARAEGYVYGHGYDEELYIVQRFDGSIAERTTLEETRADLRYTDGL